MLEDKVRKRSDQEGSDTRNGAQNDFKCESSLQAFLVERGAANGRVAHTDVAKIGQETDNDSGKPEDSIIRGGKISSHDKAC